MEYQEILAKYPAIDLQQFKGMAISDATDALSSLRGEIEMRYNQIASELIRTKRVKGYEPEFSHDPDFPTEMYKNWHRYLMTKTTKPELKLFSIASSVFPIAAYFHDCYGVSCSEYLLGYEMPVYLPPHLARWLDIAMSLSEQDRRELNMIFSNSQPVRQETLFVFKSRLTEYSNSIGCSLKSFISFPRMKSWDRTLRWEFADMPLTETGNGYKKQRSYLGATSLVRLVLLSAVNLGISPDYLLLQDYSEYIVSPSGEPYTEEEQELISKLLRSGSRTSSVAIGFVNARFAQSLGQRRKSYD